jgi:photosystem II stability/assembly factor-like uncharacterized protein
MCWPHFYKIVFLTATNLPVMRKAVYISLVVTLITGFGFSLVNPSAVTKDRNQNFFREDEESGGHEANEDFFLVRSYPDPFISVTAYESAVRDAMQRQHTTRTEESWLLEGPNNIGGRINCTAIDPNNSSVIYAGNASGGIFKTSDGGATWNPIFDEQPFLAIGAITIDPNNSQIIWVGTGDLNIGGYPFIGDGIYKSIDGGITWTNMGLAETRIISSIIIDPSNSNIIYAGTMGIPFETNNDRGLYKSTDGGATWNQVLFVDVDAGVIDMVMDPFDTQTIYATSWNRIRNNEVSIVYGPDTHIYKSTNGGTSWAILTGGLPGFTTCRTGIAISKQTPGKLYALIVDTTFSAQGIYKTTNGGASWTNVTSNFDQSVFGSQGWYFGKIFVNPTNDEEIYVPGVDMQRSTNGGSSWSQSTPPWWYYQVHADGHYISFVDGNTFYYSTDGGLYKTDDDCATWFDAENIPNTQFYHVSANNFEPENYYGGAQDNGTSGGNASTITNWPRIFGGDGFKPIFDPTDPSIFYTETQYGGLYYTTDGGSYYNDFTMGIDFTDRRSWDMPYLMSPQNHTHFFCGTYRMYEMTGAPFSAWTAISDDLTDGQVSEDRFHVITTISQSSVEANNLYAGTSDGNVWASINGGSSWNNVTSTLPERYVTSVHASPNAAATVYVTHSGYRDNDYIPHIHKSIDNGQTWTDISGDLPQMAVNDLVILPGNENKLFAATDAGVYYTEDGGIEWTRLGDNMPMMAVYDIELNATGERLMAGTFARSIWSIDIGSITGISEAVTAGSLELYPNPVSNKLSVKIVTQLPVTINVYGSRGEVNLSGTYSMQNGLIEINTENLSQGMYLMDADDGEKKWTTKFVKVDAD